MGSAASTESCVALKTLFVCHSKHESALRTLLDTHGSSGDHCELLIVTETYPRDLSTRAAVLSLCQCAVVAVDSAFQTSMELITTLSFLKDTRKRIVSGPLSFFTQPSGAVGAICTAFGSWESNLFDSSDSSLHGMIDTIRTSDVQHILDHGQSQNELDELEHNDQRIVDECCVHNDARHLMLVYADADGHHAAKAFGGLESQGLKISGTWSLCTLDLDVDLRMLAKSRVAAFIITASSVSNSSYQRLFEAALRWRKPIVPINACVRLTGWLQLAMAGKLWYQVDLEHLNFLHHPYADVPDCPCKVSDACLATDFLLCANGLLDATNSNPAAALQEPTLIATREQAIIQSAREKSIVHGLDQESIDNLVYQVENLIENENAAGLEELGVAMSRDSLDGAREQDQLRRLSVEELLPEVQSLELIHQHYTVTRMAFTPVQPVIDANGLPLPNLQLDAMFSYQWGSQDVVLDVRQQASVFNLRVWLDVFGHMHGNVNSAMATAVENVACVVVFLTQKYIESINCQLEFVYAVKCRKPLIFVCLSDITQLMIPPWMAEVIGPDFNVYPTRVTRDAASQRVLVLDYNAERVNGVPMVNVLFGAVRAFVGQRHKAPPLVVYDGSFLAYATTSALRTAIRKRAETADSASVTCTRCGALFHPGIASSLDGCRKHSAYYMGGTVMAGRWVCCQETKTHGHGCQSAQHTQAQRAWTQDPSYGTFTWQPE